MDPTNHRSQLKVSVLPSELNLKALLSHKDNCSEQEVQALVVSAWDYQHFSLQAQVLVLEFNKTHRKGQEWYRVDLALDKVLASAQVNNHKTSDDQCTKHDNKHSMRRVCLNKQILSGITTVSQ